MKIFIVCPVRGLTVEEENLIGDYVRTLELGAEVYCPIWDTDQNDAIGNRICEDNRAAIEAADEVHVWYNPASQGTLFDVGMAWALRKPLIIINRYDLTLTPEKSFVNFLLEVGK